MDKRIAKVAVGLALEAELERDDADSSIVDRLFELYATPDLAAFEALHDQPIVSDSFEDREVGLWLELGLTRRRPNLDWRDLVIDMQETELDLFDLAYLIETSEYRNEFEVLGLMDWMNSVGSSVSNIRGGIWVLAKIDLNRAIDKSLDESVERIRKNKEFIGTVDRHREATRSYFQRILTFPCESNIPENRLDTILEVQDLVIELKRKGLFEPTERGLGDVLLEVADTLGIAEDYLLDPKSGLEQAAYEAGLASEHLKEKVENIRDSDAKAAVVKILQRIESLISRLPSKSWPTEGMEYLGVESRFKKSRGRSRLIR